MVSAANTAPPKKQCIPPTFITAYHGILTNSNVSHGIPLNQNYHALMYPWYSTEVSGYPKGFSVVFHRLPTQPSSMLWPLYCIQYKVLDFSRRATMADRPTTVFHGNDGIGF